MSMTDRQRLIEEFRRNYDLNGRILREAGSQGSKFDFRNTIGPAEKKIAEEKWGKHDTTNDRQKKIFQAASAGDKSAINYIWLKVSDVVYKSFWKSYLGPDPNARRRRIEQGAFYDWAAIAYETLTHGNKDYTDTKGALETFKPDKYQSGDMFKNFEIYFWNKLRNSSKESNYNDTTSGVTGTPGIKKGVRSAQSGGKALQVGEYDPTYMDSRQETSDTSDPTFDNFMEDDDVKTFIDQWKDFVKDEAVSTPRTGGVIPIEVLKTVIEAGPDAESYKILTDKYPQVSRNSLTGFLQDCVRTMGDYGIEYDGLMTAIRRLGEDKVAGYIVSKSPPAEKARGEKSRAKTDPEFDSKFEGFLSDPHLWTSSRTNKTGTWNAGTLAHHMFKNPKMNPEDFTEKNRIPGNWNETTMKRVRKMLERQGIKWSDVEKMSKAKREELADRIAGL